MLDRIAGLGFDAVELPLENAGDLTADAVARGAGPDRPDAVRRRSPWPRAATLWPRPRTLSPPPRTTCGPASTWRPTIGAPTCAGLSTPRPAGSGGWTPGERDAAYEEWRENLAPVVDHAAERGVRARDRAAEPLRDLAGQHRRPGADRARRTARPGLGLALDTYHLNIEERSSADAIRAAGRTWPTCRSAAATGARPVATRPTGRRSSRPSTRSATPGRSTSRASPRTTRPSPGRLDLAAARGVAGRPGPRRAGVPAYLPYAGRSARDDAAPRRSAWPSSATRSWARPTPTPGATSARSTPTCRRCASRCWSAATGRRSRRPRTATAGRSRPPTGARSSSATTSTSSTSAARHLHAEIAIAALAAGKHVLVEKPLANTRRRVRGDGGRGGRARARAASASMVGFNYRRVRRLRWPAS